MEQVNTQPNKSYNRSQVISLEKGKIPPQAVDLEEVVIIGYGSQKKSDLTGAITTVKSEEIEKTPNSNVMQNIVPLTTDSCERR